MSALNCLVCHRVQEFSQEAMQAFRLGQPPPCPECNEMNLVRSVVGKRSVTAGTLRPNIVLYNEHHPSSTC
jgi:NAD-dependent histone deacetylase SIR2